MTDLEQRRAPTADEWEALMRSYPSDGWDGAAERIARHDERVRALEAELDRYDYGWRERAPDGLRPRTRSAIHA